MFKLTGLGLKESNSQVNCTPISKEFCPDVSMMGGYLSLTGLVGTRVASYGSNTLFVTGGTGKYDVVSGIQNSGPEAFCIRYRIEENEFSMMPDMIIPDSKHSCCTLGDWLYVHHSKTSFCDASTFERL